ADKRSQRDARQDTLKRIVETEYFTDKDIQKQRRIANKKWIFQKYIFRPLGSKPITEIKKSDIARMLSNIKRDNGAASANNAYRTLSAFLNWYFSQAEDEYRSPRVRKIYIAGDGARTLTDDEIRLVWNVANEGRNPYDPF